MVKGGPIELKNSQAMKKGQTQNLNFFKFKYFERTLTEFSDYHNIEIGVLDHASMSFMGLGNLMLVSECLNTYGVEGEDFVLYMRRIRKNAIVKR